PTPRRAADRRQGRGGWHARQRAAAAVTGAPATHQAQGALTSHARTRRRPLARYVPLKTFGSLPWPRVYSVQIMCLPRGSTFPRAHGRGVARLYNPVVAHLSKVETGA